jgi:hypothetical protein
MYDDDFISSYHVLDGLFYREVVENSSSLGTGYLCDITTLARTIDKHSMICLDQKACFMSDLVDQVHFERP